MAFRYSSTQQTTGPFTTRTVLDAEIPETKLTAAIAAQAGVTAQQAAAVIGAFLDEMLGHCAQSNYGTAAGGRLRYRPTSAGEAVDPADFFTADDIEANIALTLSHETLEAWRTRLELQDLGEAGATIPAIVSVLNLGTGVPAQYTPGALLRLRGDNLRFHRSDAAEGVFFTSADGVEMRAAIYGTISDREVVVLVPSTLSGPLTVTVSVQIEGVLQSAVYPMPIAQG